MAVVNFFKLFVLFTFLSSVSPRPEKNDKKTGFSLPTCSRIECPSFDVIQTSKDFEIRRYNSLVLMSTSPIQDISLVDSTKIGFRALFNYIQGKNKYSKKIEMTSPVTTQVSPSDGPVCESSYVVSFYVPKANQADVPPAEGLTVQNVGTKYAAVRQFRGFVSDDDVGKEAAALATSLAGSSWSSAIKNSSVYTVAQYNSPLQAKDRVNEIWMLFDKKEYNVMMRFRSRLYSHIF